MFFKYISFPVFLITLALGLFYVYVTGPKPNIIYVYPTPDNVSKIQYKDKADNCYVFKHEEVKCPKLPNEISRIPVQN